ncbi:BCL-6 corepressor-like protein 1 [Platysternon megacephalum]|uniref:BCL-6 corepressor-like protein 1 n=1 Tax=Platysternon megacephalum TaxID=55544 RepID=A0A4D9ECN6_9SAUR|nr:BCL-6 corepressor-like protein 1 [Platysternon megacephalum]
MEQTGECETLANALTSTACAPCCPCHPMPVPLMAPSPRLQAELVGKSLAPAQHPGRYHPRRPAWTGSAWLLPGPLLRYVKAKLREQSVRGELDTRMVLPPCCRQSS